jgi:RNA polymerase sigma factor for flagellar operon FliA
MTPPDPTSQPPAAPAPAPEPRVAAFELWQRYRAPGRPESSEEELVRTYLPLVKTVVGRLAMTLPPHVSAEDLHSVGLIGLLHAVRNFNPSLGTPFEPYARLRIRGAVLDELRRMDWATRYVHAKARQVQAAMGQLEQSLGRLPTDAEMAAALGLSMEDYARWLDEIRPATFISLDVAPSAEADDDTGSDRLDHEAGQELEDGDAPSDQALRRDLARVIRERIEHLPELQRKILAMHYFEDLRLKEIAHSLGFSEAHICQTHAKAILAIRAHLERVEAPGRAKLDPAA